MNTLKNKVALVTGASRGVGRGIAKGLGEAGMIVYVTGRTENGEGLPDFLKDTGIGKTASEVTQLGGVGIAHHCDHANDQEVDALFQRILDEQGRLDVLVNNAWGGSLHAIQPYFFNTPFWEQPMSLWEDNYTVGLRSDYYASRLAAPIMVNQKSGLIVNISYYGGRHYFNNVAYGVNKAAIDRLAADIALELKPHGVTALSLYPGQVSTEGYVAYAQVNPAIDLNTFETPQFVGRCIAALAADPTVFEKTGEILITAEVAQAYGIRDINGNQPKSQRAELW
ncbi:MAG: SDR family NAD(P)-dependent oxidoreductase [Anaerolineales bacterium]|nr:SDR family NAD(P)-dependent oxidoreductase [Anaerolineales bacterium]